jgi:diketogulonate reductase-like aldo/keto reductase
MKKTLIFALTVLMTVCGTIVFAALTTACTSSSKATISETSFNFETRTVTLNNGIKMPILGLGTYRLTPEQTENSVYHALIYGYRLIDTANAYMNEKAVGRGIKRSGVPRGEIFITTKLWPADYEDTERAINETLARLGLDYIDLLLLHQPFGNYIEGYKGMEAAVRQGKVRSIGLSNFYGKRLDEILKIATIPPAVLQVESNPFFQNNTLREYIKSYRITMNAWFPLGGRINERDPSSSTQTLLFNNETIVGIANAHNKTPAQIILRWHLQSGNIAIPGSTNPAHILENISIFDFELTGEEMQRLSTLETGITVFDFSNLDDQPNFGSFVAPLDFNNQE